MRERGNPPIPPEDNEKADAKQPETDAAMLNKLRRILDSLKRTPADTITEDVGPDENMAQREIPGIEMLGDGKKKIIDLGLGYESKAELNDDFIISATHDRNVTAANLLEALNISPDDRRHLIRALLPIIEETGGHFAIKRLDANGKVKKIRTKASEDVLTKITTQRKTDWGSLPVYSKEDFAIYLEAVRHSDLSQEEKNEFIDDLLKTEAYEERNRKGIRIRLPTGQTLGLSQDNKLNIDSPRQGYSPNKLDILFIMALVERGRLPISTLNSIYYVNTRPTGATLRNIYSVKEPIIDIVYSKPPDEKLKSQLFYVSFLLNRDPRIGEEDKTRLKRYFSKYIDLKVVPSGMIK